MIRGSRIRFGVVGGTSGFWGGGGGPQTSEDTRRGDFHLSAAIQNVTPPDYDSIFGMDEDFPLNASILCSFKT